MTTTWSKNVKYISSSNLLNVTVNRTINLYVVDFFLYVIEQQK